jgi:hypothetical protein
LRESSDFFPLRATALCDLLGQMQEDFLFFDDSATATRNCCLNRKM